MQNTSRRISTKPVGHQASASGAVLTKPGFVHRSASATALWFAAQSFWLWAAFISFLVVSWLITTDYLPRLFGTLPR